MGLWANIRKIASPVPSFGNTGPIKFRSMSFDTIDSLKAFLDAWPDFFEGEELPEIKEGNEESRVPYKPKLFSEYAMEAPADTIYYTQPIAVNNTKGSITMEMSDDDAMTRMKSLLDPVEEPKPIKTKMSYKQQQRMRKNNPMWKPN